jgi:hypothetical protein
MKVTWNALIPKVIDEFAQEIFTKIRDFCEEVIREIESLKSSVTTILDGQPRFRSYKASNQSINNATTTALNFGYDRYDTGQVHNQTTISRIEVGKYPGVWHLGGNIAWDSSTVGIRSFSIRLNGATGIAADRRTAAGDVVRQNLSCDYQFVAGDYIELTAFQDSGAALNVLFTSNFSIEVWGHRVGD